MNSGTAILKTFYRAAGEFVSTAQLAKPLRTPTERIAIEVAELEQLGYKIELHPHRGYRLLESPDRLMADDLEARLESFEASLETGPTKQRVIGSEILVFEETASTNDVCEQLARSGGRDGLVVFAESQTKGRGRHGRAWASPRGKGLWFSVLLRPKLPLSSAPRITVAASVAVAHAIRKTSGLDARIKWPNDVTVQGKKLAGILTELCGGLGSSQAPTSDVGGGPLAASGAAEGGQAAPSSITMVLGIGIDVNCQQDDFPPDVTAIATSMELEARRAFDRPALAVDVLQALDDAYLTAQTGFDSIVAEWARLSTTLGRQIVVTLGARRIEGCAQALDGDGALLMRKDNGQVERMLGGDLVREL